VLQFGESTIAGQLVIRGTVTENQLQQAVRAVGPDYLTAMRPLSELVNVALGRDRITAALGFMFGTLSLFLAAIGVGGLMAYTVAQRLKEIAIRLAIGAQARHVMNAVLNEGLAMTCAGAILGMGGGVLSTRLIRGMLFGVSPYDPFVLMIVPTLLVAVAAIACAVPAIRAARMDPISSLRAE
jgi:ABC-type antimicrobial peptide transport system permease subunit